MSNSDLFEMSVETWIKCPYDKAHLVIKNEMMDHLQVCREAYVKKMKAEGRFVRLLLCNKSLDHYVPQLELELHNILCKAVPQADSDDDRKQEPDSSSSGSLLEEIEGEAAGQGQREDEDGNAAGK